MPGSILWGDAQLDGTGAEKRDSGPNRIRQRKETIVLELTAGKFRMLQDSAR